ncbi:JAB domain-containing protein [Peribacillus frigoritolerans]|uniref:JAB domain-containing protein n=1 Tax=Peribacillus frigoritolerans TaxID=450367 RepID=UPI00203EEE6D|nr:JAB domain-containing protein [Peribacillus frigoritolerans]MCM3169478.1 JAB domain-containing protein [Peribacillus frigoritolerans]
MEKIIEVIRIKQEIRELPIEYQEYDQYTIRSPYDAIDFARALIGDEDREVFLVMTLNTKNQITAVHRCHIGSINSSIVSPREVFKSAILNNGASIIVAHNHRGTIKFPIFFLCVILGVA